MHQQVRGASSRPDLVVTSQVASVVIEVKLHASEGDGQTARQGDDFADLPDPVFVFLTRTGTRPTDGRFRPVSLRELAGHLAELLVTAGDAPGRRHADDYLSDLEATVGVSTDDDADAGFWVTHGPALLAAQEAARLLLPQLPAHVATALPALTAELGADLVVRTVNYRAQGDRGAYPETAVVLSKPHWLVDDSPVLGFAFGSRRQADSHRGPDPDDPNLRPFHGIYCTDLTLRATLSHRFLSKGWGGHWAWWSYVDLTAAPNGGPGFLTHNATAITATIRDTWLERAATVDTAWAARSTTA
ncbi:hypothetical protein ACWCYY_36835 [Kitasatospora sp. NPDC001664]